MLYGLKASLMAPRRTAKSTVAMIEAASVKVPAMPAKKVVKKLPQRLKRAEIPTRMVRQVATNAIA